jgi:hypothetical protein
MKPKADACKLEAELEKRFHKIKLAVGAVYSNVFKENLLTDNLIIARLLIRQLKREVFKRLCITSRLLLRPNLSTSIKIDDKLARSLHGDKFFAYLIIFFHCTHFMSSKSHFHVSGTNSFFFLD